MFKYIILILLSFLDCKFAVASELSSIDLRQLNREKFPAQTIEIPHDPVYLQPRRYEGFNLHEILKTMQGFSETNAQNILVLFIAEDGYTPIARLDKVLQRRGIIAFRDLDIAQGNWLNKKDFSPAPFYMVWEFNQHFSNPEEQDFPWAYKLVQIKLVDAASYYGKSYPHDSKHIEGFELFAKHCQRCHSVNLVGGVLAPELNVPHNVTEYWEEKYLSLFIQNPLKVRANSKMPTFQSILTDHQISLILNYLKSMHTQKNCAEDCNN